MMPAGSRLGSYELGPQIGAGGMGEVYQAHDTKLGRDVAIKVLPEAFAHDAERLARFQREAKMLASLNHPNIATIHGLEKSNATSYLVMELVSGETLADRIKREGPVPVEEALKIAVQIAEALEAAHEKGIIHRDLKPANVKVTPEGKVKVLDFGLAKAFAGDVADSNPSQSPTLSAVATMQGVLLGTAAYMSPEQARGKAVDKRTDLWAFGCVLYELLAGRQAFRGETAQDTISAVLEREPDWHALPTPTPVQIRNLLRRCLQKDPRRRLRDLGDARIEIEETLSGSAAAPQTNTLAISGTGRKRLQTRWVAGMAIVAAALLVAGIGFWFRRPAEEQGTVVRFAIPLPAGQHLAATDFNTVAMSPDGMNLVYVVSQSKQGGRQLYLRSLGSLEAVPIAGTEGGAIPFFSPDGQWIGFFAGTKLKKVHVGGGVVSTLCDSSASSPANWGTDGRIYFQRHGQSEIWRVSAEGGTPEPVTALDRQQGESDHLWPQLLPGGKAILFTVWTGAGIDDAQLAVQVLGTNRHRVVMRGASGGGFYVSSGHLVFVRGGTLMAVPFDLARLDVSAEAPVELVKGVLEGGTSGSFSISAGGTLAYPPGPSGTATETRLVWVDRSGRAEPLAAPPRAYRHLSLSPDGGRVAIGTLGNSADIWTYDLARNTLTRLSPEVGSLFPLWTPDGNRVTYVMFNHGTRDIYRRSADGGGDELLVASGYDTLPVSWSPDGRILAFDQDDPSTGGDLWTVDMGGDRKPHLFLKTPYDEQFPEISPDGHWLAYQSNESGRFEVYVSTFPVPGQKWQISTDGGGLPTWAHSGSELFYRSGNKMMAVDVRTEPTFAAGLPHMLFQGDYYDFSGRSYDVSPDGKRFLMLQAVGEEQNPTQINIVLNWFEELKRRKFPPGK